MKRKAVSDNPSLPFPTIAGSGDNFTEPAALNLADDFCCELLAWFHVCGGATEAVVLDENLSADLRRAAERLNIEGGKSPDAALLRILQNKMQEAKNSLEKGIPPVWILNVTSRYRLPRPRRGIDY